MGDPDQIAQAIKLMEQSKKPVVLSGSGVFWSDAVKELNEWVIKSGMPIYTTPQGRGVLPEDHPRAFLNARSAALKEADLLLVVGTRLNYVFGHLKPPRISKSAKVIRIDVDPSEISASSRVDLGILGDAKTVLMQLIKARAFLMRTNMHHGATNWPLSMRANKKTPSRRCPPTTCRYIPCAYARRFVISWIATQYWLWMARKFSTTAGNPSRPYVLATGSTQELLAPWASACLLE
jgi:thiamine pyrophosphate-dependent acetolactate synthase large subunit-like protein